MGDTKVIFWDVYGTLVAAPRGNLDSLLQREAELLGVFERTVKNFGLAVVPARLHDLFLRGVQAEREARVAQGIAHPEVRIDEIWFKLLEKFQPEEPPTINFAREVALFFQRQANPTQLQPHAFDVLNTLGQRGLRHGIISNAQFYTPIELSALLREESACAVCTYESMFDPLLVFFSFDLGVAKPDLAIFGRAVEALTRENVMPDDCVFVGNSLVNDIAPAQHIGFRTVLFAPEVVPESAIKPDLVIHNLSQLLEWL
jgi:putative hydrolase of the HAD superfamily